MIGLNEIILKGNRYRNTYRFNNSVTIEVDPDFQPEVHANHEWEVVSAPDGIPLKKGDKIISHWWVAMHQNLGEKEHPDYYWANPDQIYIKYDEDGNMTGFDLFSIVEHIYEEDVLPNGIAIHTEPKKLENYTRVIGRNDRGLSEVGDVLIHPSYGVWTLTVGEKMEIVSIISHNNVYGKLKDGKIIPRHETVFIAPPEEKESELNGILLSNIEYVKRIEGGVEKTVAMKRSDSYGTVIAVGEQIDDINIDDTIVYRRRNDNSFTLDEKKYFFCVYQDVEMVIDSHLKIGSH